MKKITVKLKSFTTTPMGRTRGVHNNHSAQEFWEDYVLPSIRNTKETVEVTIDVSGAYGLPASWKSQLVYYIREMMGKKSKTAKIEIVSDNEEDTTDFINEFREQGENCSL